MGGCCGKRTGWSGVQSQRIPGKCGECGWALRVVHTYSQQEKKLVRSVRCLNGKCASNKWKPQ